MMNSISDLRIIGVMKALSIIVTLKMYVKNVQNPFMIQKITITRYWEYLMNIFTTIYLGLLLDIVEKIYKFHLIETILFPYWEWEFVCYNCKAIKTGYRYLMYDNKICCSDCMKIIRNNYNYELRNYKSKRAWLICTICSFGGLKCKKINFEDGMNILKKFDSEFAKTIEVLQRHGAKNFKIDYHKRIIKCHKECKYCGNDIKCKYKYGEETQNDIREDYNRCLKCSPNDKWNDYIYRGNGKWSLFKVYVNEN